MWFPDAPLIRVGLSQHGLTIARAPGLGRAAQPGAERLECTLQPGAAEPWRAAVDRLAQWLGEQGGQRFKVCVVLSGRFVRWQLLPWHAELPTRSERSTFAALRFREIFGKTAAAWNILAASLPPGHSAPAAAVDNGLLAALGQACQASGSQLQQVSPYFSQAFDNWQAKHKGSPVWFGALESDCITLGLLQDGRWRALQGMRLAGDWRAPLADLQQRMALAQGLDAAAAPLYLAGDVVPAPQAGTLPFIWLQPRGTEAAPAPGLRLALGH